MADMAPHMPMRHLTRTATLHPANAPGEGSGSEGDKETSLTGEGTEETVGGAPPSSCFDLFFGDILSRSQRQDLQNKKINGRSLGLIP